VLITGGSKRLWSEGLKIASTPLSRGDGDEGLERIFEVSQDHRRLR
jgi:hypothetical protein